MTSARSDTDEAHTLLARRPVARTRQVYSPRLWPRVRLEVRGTQQHPRGPAAGRDVSQLSTPRVPQFLASASSSGRRASATPAVSRRLTHPRFPASRAPASRPVPGRSDPEPGKVKARHRLLSACVVLDQHPSECGSARRISYREHAGAGPEWRMAQRLKMHCSRKGRVRFRVLGAVARRAPCGAQGAPFRSRRQSHVQRRRHVAGGWTEEQVPSCAPTPPVVTGPCRAGTLHLRQ